MCREGVCERVPPLKHIRGMHMTLVWPMPLLFDASQIYALAPT